MFPPELVSKVEQSRRLKLKEPVPCVQTSTNRQIADFLEESLDKRLTPRELAIEELQLKLLGAIPEGWRYREEILRLYVSRLSAFYSPEFKRFVLARGFSRDSQEIVAHELTHALQDQHYNLSLLTDNRFTNDELMARMAVFEGDANISMKRVVGKSWCEPLSLEDLLQQLDYLANSKAPKFLEAQVAAPYLFGERYLCLLIKRARKSGKSRDLWETLEGEYHRLPRSSIVLFDREDRWEREEMPFSGEVLRQDSLGPVGIIALLMNIMSAKEAGKIVEAVTGDNLLLGLAPSPRLLWLINVKDNNASVKETLRAALSKLYDHSANATTSIRVVERGVFIERRQSASVNLPL